MLITIENKPEFFNVIIETLRKGGVIALPTDTVYGFAIDGSNTDAFEKLATLKKRSKKPFTFFIPKSSWYKYAILAKRKIIDYFIPGPLTVILKKRIDVSLPFITEKIGMRIPQIDFVIKLLSIYKNPLAVTSANLAGRTPLNSAVEIAEQFTEIDLVINGGELLSQPSTVIDLTTTPPTALRKGRIPILEIEKVYGRRVLINNSLKFNVLFVCSANTCRSPMAEGIFRTLIAQEYCSVRSAGILPMNGLPPARFSVDVVKEYGGSITNNLIKSITKQMIDWADLILVMEFKHYDSIMEIAPEAAVKTFLLKEYKRRVKYNEISDPIGKDIYAYREAAKEMLPSLKLIAKDIERLFRKDKE